MLLLGQGHLNCSPFMKRSRPQSAEPELDNRIVCRLPKPLKLRRIAAAFQAAIGWAGTECGQSLDQIASPRQTVAEITGDRVDIGLAASCDQRLLWRSSSAA
jgi:hypothetical protein